MQNLYTNREVSDTEYFLTPEEINQGKSDQQLRYSATVCLITGFGILVLVAWIILQIIINS